MAAPILPIILSLAQFAPSIMRFFGAGESSVAVADQVVGVAKAVAGTSDPEQALEMLRHNVKLQIEFQQRILDLDGELEKAFLADRRDARARDIEYVKAGRVNTRANAMVLFDAIGLVACLCALVFLRKDLPGEAVGLISTIAGIFGVCLRDAHQFEFGSSRGSREKDELLAQLGAKKA